MEIVSYRKMHTACNLERGNNEFSESLALYWGKRLAAATLGGLIND